MANIILAVFIAFTAGATCLDLKNIKGRLLTPEEGCGISKVPNTKIVGGGVAKQGKLSQVSMGNGTYLNRQTIEYDIQVLGPGWC